LSAFRYFILYTKEAIDKNSMKIALGIMLLLQDARFKVSGYVENSVFTLM
jgi:hypothetical protein